MIIIDINQLLIANFFVMKQSEINESLVRHMVINSIKFYKKKFGIEYGNIVIATEGNKSWRKGIFPYYKMNRHIKREESIIDWNKIYTYFNLIINELKEYFPYRIINVEHAEADDIIASLVFTFKDQKILIISSDKDFKQLQIYDNVYQYHPVQKKWIVESNPKLYLIEHILRGDSGDGIPNAISEDDSIINNSKRQKPLRNSKIEEFLQGKINSNMKYYSRNEMLIDFNNIPVEIQNEIVIQYNEQSNKDRSKLLKYFQMYDLKVLMQSLNDF